MKTSIQELMARSGVKFGTSGARGLADAMTDQVCYSYTLGFLQYLRGCGSLASPARVAVAGDLRPSSDRIALAVCRAIEDYGGTPVYCGKIPSPAVALYGLEQGVPAITITGSHIPDDRNGIKFNKPTGEILKQDEVGISSQTIQVDDQLFTAEGDFRGARRSLPNVEPAARQSYLRRYLDTFEGTTLKGLRVAVYEHSAVGREVIREVLQGLGAEVTSLGRSERFIPVDTEAIRPEDARLAREWAQKREFDSIVSADGDSDRPLVSDESGEWIRGDLLGILTARFLAADSVSTPISSNTAVEKSHWFPEVRRTRIGSPFVIESMLAAAASGRKRVVGYEANGGFLIQSEMPLGGRTLRPLPTRDAMIVILAALMLSRAEGRTLSRLVESLPARYTASDRLKEFPIEKSREILAGFTRPTEEESRAALDAAWGPLAGSRVREIDRTDGVRVQFDNDEILHFRPSGNAPEFRCYSEAASPQRAEALCRDALAQLQK